MVKLLEKGVNGLPARSVNPLLADSVTKAPAVSDVVRVTTVLSADREIDGIRCKPLTNIVRLVELMVLVLRDSENVSEIG